MRRRDHAFLLLLLFILFVSNVSAQIVSKTGEIYGRVSDEKKLPLSNVLVTLESVEIPNEETYTGSGGNFRFINLPPGIYTATFGRSGFVEIKQDEIRVTTGSHVELEIIMSSSLNEESSVIANADLLDRKKTGNSVVYTQEYLEQIPNGRDPWFILAMSGGVDSSRLETGTGSVFQATFFGRGDSYGNNTWIYDGINHNDPGAPGAPSTYFDFEAFEEIQITTGGSDVSIQTGGIGINLVTKRGGNSWDGQASLFHSNETRDYGFNVGGPVLKDKLFAWGGYRFLSDHSQEDVIIRESSSLEDINAKINLNWTSAHSSQLGYFLDTRTVEDRDFIGNSAPEALLDLVARPKGIWTLEHTWVANDQLLLTARYGFVGRDFAYLANGGTDKPVIYLDPAVSAENTWISFGSTRNSHNVHFDGNYFKENVLGGDHEFRFGFEYNTSHLDSFTTYGNGIFITDYYQTIPNAELISGSLTAQHPTNPIITRENASAYFSDTFRIDRLMLNLGMRFDYQTGKNEPSEIPAVPGYEEFVGPFIYSGGDPSIATKDFSPRLGATYALTGDNKTLLKANYARYYDTFQPNFLWHSNPTAIYNGALFDYVNADHDRTITPDEIVGGPYYFGGNSGGEFNLETFNASRLYDDDLSNAWTNEFILGIERELTKDFFIAATLNHRRYGNFLRILPFGVTTEDYIPGGVFTATTPVGNFSVPYFVLGYKHDGTAILKNIKDYEQSYNGLDITLQKRMSNNFLFNGSFTFQHQTGHYNGGDSLAIQTERAVRFGATFPYDPTNLPFVQDQMYSYAGSGSNTHPFSEWTLKLSGVYLLPWNISTGAFIRYQQGYPMVLFGNFFDNTLQAFNNSTSHIILVEPLGSRRYDNIFTVDFQIQKSFGFGEKGRISGILTVFNLTNTQTVTGRFNFVSAANFNDVFTTLDERSYRFGLRYSF